LKEIHSLRKNPVRPYPGVHHRLQEHRDEQVFVHPNVGSFS
jgi:hypothetical protein